MESSDEEYSQQLREALDPELMTDALFGNKECAKEPSLPSKRCKHKEDDQFNILGVTPQFQDYVAKHLSVILEKDLEKRLVSVQNECVRRKMKNRIRLFNDSENHLKLHKNKRTIKKRDSEKYDSDDDSRFREAAVKPSDIIDKTDVQHWSTKTKGKVFHYQMNSTGTLTLVD